MKENKAIFKLFGNIVFFGLFIYLIVIGQKNIGPVKWIAAVLKVDNIKPVGLCIMIIAILGLLIQLYYYNKKYQ